MKRIKRFFYEWPLAIPLAVAPFLIALMFATRALAYTAPAPYTDPSQATTNAIGGIATGVGCTVTPGATFGLATASALWDANGCTSTTPGVGLPALTPALAAQSRVAIVKLTAAGVAAGRVCVVLGQVGTVAPAFTCPDSNAVGPYGNCSLVNAGDSCTLTLRPQVSGCTSWNGCIPGIALARSASATASYRVDVGFAQ